MERTMKGDIPKEIGKKLDSISKIVAEKGSYMESTPMFMRVLSNPVVEKFENVKVIHLLRDPMEVARSYVNRESYPSHESRPWRIPLNSPQSRFKFPLKLTPLQENLCDWLENELRFLENESKFSATVDFYFSDYNNVDALAKMFAELRLKFDRTKLEYHLKTKDLDQNSNSVTTEISETDKAEAVQLIRMLGKSGFPTEKFLNKMYQRFWFTRILSKQESRLMNYNRFYTEGGFNAASREWLMNHTDLKEFAHSIKNRKLTLLDVGCGDGEWTEALSKWYDATGIDISSAGIDVACKRNVEGLNFICSDFRTLDINDQFDVIFCRAPSFLNHETGSKLITKNISKLLQHCKGRLYYIKYTREPFERWVPSRLFSNFDTDPESAPDSKWYYHDPRKLEVQLNKIAPTEIYLRNNYLVAVMDLLPKPTGLRAYLAKLFNKI